MLKIFTFVRHYMNFILSKVFVNIKTVLQIYCTQCLYWLNFFFWVYNKIRIFYWNHEVVTGYYIKKILFLYLNIKSILANSADPDEMTHCMTMHLRLCCISGIIVQHRIKKFLIILNEALFKNNFYYLLISYTQYSSKHKWYDQIVHLI